MRPAATIAALLGASALAAGCSDDVGLPDDAGEARTVTVDIGDGSQPPQPDQREPIPEIPGAESCDGAGAPTTEENLRQTEVAIRCLTNAARRQKGLSELTFDERLARAAANRSQAMADADFFGHRGPGDSNVRSAVRATGWVPDGRSWVVGENIGWAEGDATPATIVQSWLQSPRHRANILGEHFRRIGIGAVAAVPKQDAQPGATFTQIFGATGEAARAAQTGE